MGAEDLSENCLIGTQHVSQQLDLLQVCTAALTLDPTRVGSQPSVDRGSDSHKMPLPIRIFQSDKGFHPED